jgi:hypothetical protein
MHNSLTAYALASATFRSSGYTGGSHGSLPVVRKATPADGIQNVFDRAAGLAPPELIFKIV